MAYKGMAQIDKKELWTIPNLITYFRILCIPAYIVLMSFAGVKANPVLLYVALGVFAVAAGSDLVDGWIARRFNMTSGIGMALDPLADKLMHISVLFCLSLCTGLTPLGEATEGLSDLGVATMTASGGWYVHYAFVILLLLKEAIMVCVAPLVMKKGAKVQANWTGVFPSLCRVCGLGHPGVGRVPELRRRVRLSFRHHPSDPQDKPRRDGEGDGGEREDHGQQQ